MEKIKLQNLTKEEKREFYQSKYDYYRKFVSGLITVSTLSYLAFFITDCGIFGRFAYETLLSRAIILAPYVLFLFLVKNIKDYRITIPCMYLMIHMIIWCTDWATYLLPDRRQAVAGMIIMNLIFVCAGFAAPLYYSIPAHVFMIVDIFVANQFIHYQDLLMMYLFNVPCVVAICVMQYMMQQAALEQHVTKCQLNELAAKDQLTGVGNRNKFREIVDMETGEFLFQKGMAVSVLLMDIDFFKKFNDDFGHDAGDTVLAYLGRTLRETLRSTDYIIRWGGEEFLVLMPGCDIQQAEKIAEMLRKKVERGDSGVSSVTLSIGVASYEGGDCRAAIKKADSAMYEAKNSGRNRVVVWNER